MGTRNPDPELIEKERQVLELRRAGATYDEIARATGYATAQGAYLAYGRALKRTLNAAGAEEAREMELDRLDRLQRTWWPKAISGDDKATDRVLKIMEHRAKYLGLYAPTKMQVEAVVYDAGTIEGEVQRLRQLLASDSGQSSSVDRYVGETRAITE
jgi:hypothetical protein